MKFMRPYPALAFLAALALAAGQLQAGSLDAPAGPVSAESAMFTLTDVYNVLVSSATTNKRAGSFAEPSGEPGGGTGRSVDEVYAAVQANIASNMTIAPVTGQTSSYAVDDDGALQKGRAWPSPRFTVQSTNAPGLPDNRTNCVLDNLTGLMWTRNANLAGSLPWTNAIDYCNNMNSGAGTYGYTDWRMPNLPELYSLLDYQYANPCLCNAEGTGQWTDGDPFVSVQSASYHSSTYRAYSPSDQQHVVSFAGGTIGQAYKRDPYYVWPVRGGK